VEERLRAIREEGALDVGRGAVPAGLEPGKRVRSRSLGVEGVILELRTDEAIIDAGGVRISLPGSDLESLSGDGARGSSRPISPPLPDIDPVTEVHLLGLRVDEVEAVLTPAIDAAVVNDVPSLRIVHGKGTGALRDEVARIAAADRRVRSIRPGGFQEGGSGVTVVQFDDVRD
jgi:DNA mismatch repair protein MutS2